MGTFKDRVNYQPHNFNTFALSFTYGDDTYKATGLNTFSAERDEDEVTVESAADGVGIFVEDPVIKGAVTFEIMEADPTNKWLWDRQVGGHIFSLSAADSNMADLEVKGGQCRISKAPVIEKKKEIFYVSWNIITVYLDVKSGGYALVSA